MVTVDPVSIAQNLLGESREHVIPSLKIFKFCIIVQVIKNTKNVLNVGIPEWQEVSLRYNKVGIIA